MTIRQLLEPLGVVTAMIGGGGLVMGLIAASDAWWIEPKIVSGVIEGRPRMECLP